MDIQLYAGTFATLVGLLSNFAAERSGAELTSFIAWLKEHHQDQLAATISANNSLSHELSGLFSTNHTELIQRLNSLNEQLAKIAVGVDGFAKISQQLSTKSTLSEQAKSILHQIIEHNIESIMEVQGDTGSDFLCVGGTCRNLQYNEPRHMNEDLQLLVSFGLIRTELTAQGTIKYLPTRNGEKFIKLENHQSDVQD